MINMKFVIFHGAFGNPKENWFPWLAEKLKAQGHTVKVPEMPVDNWDTIESAGKDKAINEKQTLENWTSQYETELLDYVDEDTILVGHSLSPIFILHMLKKNKTKVKGAVFAAPFMQSLNREDLWMFEIVNSSFYSTDFNASLIRELIPTSYVLFGSDDPYVPKGFSLDFAKLTNAQTFEIPNGEHLGSNMNGEFPKVLELCFSLAEQPGQQA